MTKQRDGGDGGGDVFAEALTRAMRAIDKQIEREMQRTPAEREVEGVQKWGPLQVRVERAVGVILDGVADQEFGVDAVVVMTRAFTSALRMIAEDLGKEGLGELRSEYILDAMERAQEDARRALALFTGESFLN